MRQKPIQLSDHFTYGKLLKFTLPSIIMMVFTSIYSVVDGYFVSNYVGKTSFAAVNFIMPFLMILGAVGFMFGTGGSALTAKTMGEGKSEKSKEIFSLIIYTSLISGFIIAILGFIFIKPIASLLGADGELLENCVTYGHIITLALPAFIIQQAFQSFFITAEKPALGLAVTVAAGITNMILDALFVAVFNWGLQGAAAATAISQAIGGIVPLIYFSHQNKSCLRLTKTKFDKSVLLRTCINGSSELMSNISASL
ncbi:MAG: MATE family efflux transporter, partial [Ruminococcus sp.]|nr:MATE family efflux transporter [Ruminococcus sp.]